MMSTGLPWLQVGGSTRSSRSIDSAAIGQDREPVALLPARQRQCLGGVEQLGHGVDAQHSGAAEGGLMDGVAAGEHPGMRRCGASPAVEWPALSTSTGLAHAAARAADMNLRPWVMPST